MPTGEKLLRLMADKHLELAFIPAANEKHVRLVMTDPGNHRYAKETMSISAYQKLELETPFVIDVAESLYERLFPNNVENQNNASGE